MNFFMEAAKLRAARLLWHRIMDGFGAKKPESLMLRTHCQTSGVSLQEQDPYNNIVRTAYEALAAVLGGTQCLHTNSFDEAIALPTEFSARIARNTQLILQHETGVTQVVDPLAGSYYVESLTAELADEAWALIEEVDALGGMTRAVASGMPKLRIEESRGAAAGGGRPRRGGDRRGQPLPAGEGGPLDIRDVDNVKVREAQVARLARIRATRDAAPARRRSARWSGGAAGGNLLAAAVEAARARATRGRDLGRDGGGLRAAPGRGEDARRRLRRGLRGRRRLRGDPGGRRARSPRRRGGGRGCWSSRWARTGTTAAPR